ncbi:MAG: SDR family oxidoreductase [Methylocystaceae bacterium]|nr:SDR family oxidoreductase [Methylocystaceae bacterium]
MSHLDQVAVITGGSTGIGFSIAEELIRKGAKRVYITGRTEKTLNEAQEKLGEKALTIVSDVSKLSDVEKIKGIIEEEGYSLDMIFANAGIAEKNTFGQTTPEEFDRTFNINVKGVFFTVQTLMGLLKNEGNIVLTGSIVGNKGMPNLSLYNASKAAVRSFARSWASDLKERKIRVNSISPGMTYTPIMKNGLKMDDAELTALKEFAVSAVPAARIAAPEEIARAAVFLSSRDASYINGIEFTIDGGYSQI